MRELPPIDLTGFNPGWGDHEHSWGQCALHEGKPWKENRYHCEILGRFNHDYMGSHLYVQVWDYAQQDDPDQRWQYMLLLDRPTRHVDEDGLIVGGEWNWTIRSEYEELPSYAQVGADVDLWVTAPEILRFIVE